MAETDAEAILNLALRRLRGEETMQRAAIAEQQSFIAVSRRRLAGAVNAICTLERLIESGELWSPLFDERSLTPEPAATEPAKIIPEIITAAPDTGAAEAARLGERKKAVTINQAWHRKIQRAVRLFNDGYTAFGASAAADLDEALRAEFNGYVNA